MTRRRRFQYRKKRKWPEADIPEPTILSFTDKLKIIGLPISIVAIIVIWRVFCAISDFDQKIDNTMARWRTEFHLTDEQERRIRIMEKDFHGNGNPLLSPTRTVEETLEHHRAMADLMNPEDGARFLQRLKNY